MTGAKTTFVAPLIKSVPKVVLGTKPAFIEKPFNTNGVPDSAIKPMVLMFCPATIPKAVNSEAVYKA